MKVTGFKKILLGLSTASLLLGCTKTLEVDAGIISAAFDSISIDFDMMIANDRVDNPDDPHYDLTEMVDASDKEAIYLFISLFDEVEDHYEDRLMYITTDYVYTYVNEDMTRTENPYDSGVPSYYADILTIYTTLFDLESLSLELFKGRALAIIEPSLTKTNNRYTLKGAFESNYPLPDDERFESEFVYTDTHLLQASQSRRHTTDSTWQQSNFISGIDYFFGIAEMPEFPPLQEFGF